MKAARKPLIAGNWKMHHGGLDGLKLAMEVKSLASELSHVELLIAPPFTAIAAVACEMEGSGVLVAAQNMHGKPHGAFTGEVSAPMLAESGARWVILGHSERRQFFGETDQDVEAKIRAALDASLVPLVCVGETLAEREAGKTLEIVGRQIKTILDTFASDPHPAAIAYEPVWAIGTGKNASPQDAESVHMAIRHWLAEKNPTVAARTRILYGGSVKPDNAAALLSQPNVDGALIGGASLDAGSFGAIAKAAEAIAKAPNA